MTSIEHQHLKGFTIKNLLITIFSTASIVASFMTGYLEVKADLKEIRSNQENTAKIFDLRLKVLETQVDVLQHQVDELKGYN